MTWAAKPVFTTVSLRPCPTPAPLPPKRCDLGVSLTLLLFWLYFFFLPPELIDYVVLWFTDLPEVSSSLRNCVRSRWTNNAELPVQKVLFSHWSHQGGTHFSSDTSASITGGTDAGAKWQLWPITCLPVTRTMADPLLGQGEAPNVETAWGPRLVGNANLIGSSSLSNILGKVKRAARPTTNLPSWVQSIHPDRY